MQDVSMCPSCHVAVRPTDYFCYNCGKNLKPSPKSTAAIFQISLYMKSILLPPFGILYALPYLKQKDQKSKIVGIVAIVLTITSLIAVFVLTKNLIDSVNRQAAETMNMYSF